ncbi:hypothetical protein [Mesorhizobium argentiipisi]|uniref:Uncharacterized protein n=1 Tax=Mesorhizobium argentiipisi TaxID=3015175 RepID=A0ABU8K7I8_9HYPH
MTVHAKNVETATVSESGTEVFIPLNKLKKSPRNARKTPPSWTRRLRSPTAAPWRGGSNLQHRRRISATTGAAARIPASFLLENFPAAPLARPRHST